MTAVVALAAVALALAVETAATEAAAGLVELWVEQPLHYKM